MSLPFPAAICPSTWDGSYEYGFLVLVFVLVLEILANTLLGSCVFLRSDDRQPFPDIRDEVLLVLTQQAECRAYSLPLGQGLGGAIRAQRHMMIFEIFRQHLHVGLKVGANRRFVARSQFVIALLELYFRRPEPSVFECYSRSLSAFMLSGLPLLLLISVQFPRDCTRQRFFGIRGDEFRVLSGHAPSSEQGLSPFVLLLSVLFRSVPLVPLGLEHVQYLPVTKAIWLQASEMFLKGVQDVTRVAGI